ncbi:MAG: hypothetical protein IPL08_11420 [Saprospiraceae bacterium]|nr:hypothetical protein [Saprospiraceae bacterium]
MVIKVENTMILATVVASAEAKPDQSFFPLSVDYQERFAAAEQNTAATFSDVSQGYRIMKY